MSKKVFVIDINKCNGCHNCQIVCKDEHVGNDWTPIAKPQPDIGQFWIELTERVRGTVPKVKVAYRPNLCMHCDNAPCMEACKYEGALYKREDGLVIVNPEKCTGCRLCVDACPYEGVIWFNEDLYIAQKCTGCAHLLDDGWKEPRCVEACPTGALLFGDLDDPQSELSKALAAAGARLEVLHPEYGLEEKVGYVGVPKAFVAGAVVFGDKDECAAGVTVTLEGGGNGASAAKQTTQTDPFGDFEFEGLPENTSYKVKIAAPGYKAQEFAVRTGASVYLGDIVLDK